LIAFQDHQALKKKLTENRAKLFESYMDEMRMKSFELPKDDYIDSLKNESAQFWNMIANDTKPSNIRQVVEFLKTYEVFVIYERAKLEVVEKYMNDEVALVHAEKETLIKEVIYE
jgi:hypothetical protein